MSQKKHKPEEIVAKLRQVDVLVSQGRSALRKSGAIRTGFMFGSGVDPAPLCRKWRQLRTFGKFRTHLPLGS